MGRKLTTEEFINKVKEIHGDKYDYSLVEYENSLTKVLIIDEDGLIHEQVPTSHLRGNKLTVCSVLNKTIFIINNFKKVHGDKYDYSLVEYINTNTKVKIICHKHGIFEQRVLGHLEGKGCSKCKGRHRYTTEEFINKAKEIHGDKYDYSLVEYIKTKVKVKIICSEHGIFEQTPHDHINNSGCSKCSGRHRYTTEEFINKVKEIHGDKYDYSLVEYINNRTKVKIICSEHGIFEQIAESHYKCGCSKCSGCYRYTTEEFINKAKETHDDKYDYSLVEYINSYSKVKIICPEHGIFKQKPTIHYKSGCNVCTLSKNEKIIYDFLKSNNINFEIQYKFNDCKYIHHLPFDFYLIDYNICVEYDGKQHFLVFHKFGGEKRLKDTKRNDKIKTNFCKDNNIPLIRINYKENTEEKLISELKKYKTIKTPNN